jgi:hypothetical protein
MQSISRLHSWNSMCASINNNDLIADQTIGTYFSFGVLSNKIFGLLFYSHFYLYHWLPDKFQFFNSTYFHAGEPDIITFLQASYVVKNGI